MEEKVKVSGCVTQDQLDFLGEIQKLLVDEVLNGTDRERKVIEFLHPEQLKEKLDLRVGNSGTDNSTLLEICQTIAKYTVKTIHPRHFNLLYSGLDVHAFSGALLAEVFNINLHTYETGSVFVLIEGYMISELCKLVGFSEGDGVFVPGSSLGNMTAIHLARYHHSKSIKKDGLFNVPRLCIFCSEECHYSLPKGASFLGLGTDSVRKVKAVDGCMDPRQLDRQIEQCKLAREIPLMVVATSGTTVLGGYDSLNDVADICQKHNVWFHVDAAWGGGVLYSQQHKSLLMNGVERADSLVWSLHKFLAAHLQCAVLLVKHKGLLEECNGEGASYLFQKDKFYDISYDVGDKTIQCGRKIDCFKFWLMWKAIGNDGMRKQVERAFDNARYFTEELKKLSDKFRLVKPNFQCVNICFWYIPERLRAQQETQAWWQELGKVAPKIKAEMMISGSTMVAYQPLESQGLVNFFRIILANPLSTKSDLDFVIQEIDRLGNDL